ncbi:MAG: hypothetical protein B7Z60_06470 [Ferrovum sp. 37-45-19]|jgi:uncharacterized membrane protein|nr:MAG: hypothetical protein B7Z65_04440 [Ferrovum sp. 21-44-67]OYV94088.1 MAG: hypothetical protein B7Z60_06470 [Ferrovum sp. 37-45-19]OZB33978.1 MAG: hypothetical protein B7X47_02420 [Ferrovum sp. 34-44-207]HQT82090.1 heparan-alpha-glucosaminide N-acetyltransferase [Ferrovaceae bacterium]HQU05840.1 heparan-alpha-glucosaminide N-acetyltransferase [Ferrovaceae bacterium]
MASPSNINNSKITRLLFIDELRGMAICMMVVFHFCYDLNYFHYTQFNILESSFWTTWRTVIVAWFVFISGVSISFAPNNHTHFIKRITKLFLSAVTISIVTYFLFGNRFIYFGVIHFFLIATMVTYPIRENKKSLAMLGTLILLISNTCQLSVMNPNYLNWIGLNSLKPATEDYAPLFPWLGLYFIGVASAPFLIHKKSLKIKALSVLGQHSLMIYLIHQPVLFLLFSLASTH